MAAALATPTWASGPDEKTLPTGKLIEKVICQDDGSQSYALYLPSSYTPEKQWPAIYAWEPAARSTLAVELLRETAEKYGWIAVCSNNSRNGPVEPIKRAITAVWNDTNKRLSIDSKRVYATGFSGGARVSSRFFLMLNKACAGIIACGAGLSTGIKDLSTMKGVNWYGIVGHADFNYNEMVRLDEGFDAAGVTHFVDFLEIRHRWPEKAVLQRAVEWMEVLAMKAGTRAKDDSLAQNLFQKFNRRASELETAGKEYYAARVYLETYRIFDGLLDASAAKEKGEKLQAGKAFKQFRDANQKRLRREQEIHRLFGKVFHFVRNPANPKKPIKPEQAIKEMHLKDLIKEAANKKDVYAAGMAQRVLYDLGVKADRMGREYLQKRDIPKASVFLEIAAKSDPFQRMDIQYYNLACAYAIGGEKKKALKFLKSAIKKGFKNRAQIERDTDLANLRNEKEFKSILESL